MDLGASKDCGEKSRQFLMDLVSPTRQPRSRWENGVLGCWVLGWANQPAEETLWENRSRCLG